MFLIKMVKGFYKLYNGVCNQLFDTIINHYSFLECLQLK